MEAAVGTVGIVGFGRFGRSLCELMAESGLDVRVFDPHAPVPGPIATASLGALVREDALIDERAGWARGGGLGVDGTLRVFRAILDQSRAYQSEPDAEGF